MGRKHILWVLPVCIFCGCHLGKRAASIGSRYIKLDTVNVVAKGGAREYRAVPTRLWDITHTRIALTFNWLERTANAREWVTLHPYFYDQDCVVLDAKSMKIDTVALVGKNGLMPLPYEYKNDSLIVHTGKTAKSDTLQLYFRYTAKPYAEATGGSSAITEDRGLYFINTDHKIPGKPAEIWTQGETESNSHWMITIDKPNTRFTTQVELTVPDSLTTLSNGALVAQSPSTNGMRTDIWRMDMPIQAYVVMFAIGKFSITRDNWRGKEVSYYTEPEYAPYAREMFQHATDMLDCFSDQTGVPYPWNKYSQIVVRDYVSGAMENTSATLHGEFMNRTQRELLDNNGEDVIAHELFHQWFGDYATCASWSNLTLNESFANFGEQIWRNCQYGKESADELAYNDLQRYLASSHFRDPQLVRYYYGNREEMFDGVTYNKGGAILRYLCDLAGHDAFREAMRHYLTTNALRSAEVRDWQNAVEEATGRDWNWFFNEWYFYPGHPVLKVDYFYNDTAAHGDSIRLTVVVRQQQSDSPHVYELPLRAVLITPGASNGSFQKSIKEVDWDLTQRNDTFVFTSPKGMRPIFIPDYHHVLPGEIIENKTPEMWLAQYQYSDSYLDRRIALETACNNLYDSVMDKIIDLALADKYKSLRKYAVEKIKVAQDKDLKLRWHDRVKQIAVSDKDNQTKAVAIGVLSAWKDTASRNLFVAACADSSYAVAGAGLNALFELDTIAAYQMAKKLIPTGLKADLEIRAWAIVGICAHNEDIALFEHYAPLLIGNSGKNTFLNSLCSYIKGVNNDSSFAKACALMANYIPLSGSKTMRMRYGNLFFSAAETVKEDGKSTTASSFNISVKYFEIMKPFLKTLADDENDASLKEAFAKKYQELLED